MTHNPFEPPKVLPPDVLLADLVALPGPPGQEKRVRDYVGERARALGYACRVDAKGNLLAAPTDAWPERPRVVVTAHLDEIALLVTGIEADGAIRVAALGGAHPWKWGEGPVEVLASGDVLVPGVLGWGSIHTSAPQSVAQQARDGMVPTWAGAQVWTGRTAFELEQAGVRPGTRVVVARSRRALWPLASGLVASYFLDDRADLVAWLGALEMLRDEADLPGDVLFAATVSEEVGGEGAAFLLQSLRPDVCVALEIGPRTPDAMFPLDDNPTVWVSDPFATMDPRDLDLVAEAGRQANLSPHWQALTRGGSDASCAAARGLCARPVTLAFAAENSHGFEVMHHNAPANLARLLVAYLRALARSATA